MNVHRENMMIALQTAITSQMHYEREIGYTRDSALVAGWKQVLEALKRGESISVY